MPRNGAEWDQLYLGTLAALNISAVREVISASYERILIDEYQDCPSLQHTLAVALSKIVPTTIFGDPMQGIFEFAGAILSWENEIHNNFPLAGILDIPHRWEGKNPELGAWIAEVREKLIRGDQIDLEDSRINFRVSNDAFDMSVFFEGIDGKEGSIAAIHCNKTICYRLARAARGGYQAIEEIAANRLSQFAIEWGNAIDGEGRKNSIFGLLNDCFNMRVLAEGETATPEEIALLSEIKLAVQTLDSEHYLDSAKSLFALCRQHPRWKLYRSDLWRDAERSLIELLSGRYASMVEAAGEIRQRMSYSGRKLPLRTVSTPLLLKGLEFDHVVVPDATHFTRERYANAKLFYVAISRATRSLTISAPSRFLKFDEPLI